MMMIDGDDDDDDDDDGIEEGLLSRNRLQYRIIVCIFLPKSSRYVLKKKLRRSSL